MSQLAQQATKPKIFKPKNNLPYPNQHVGDTFREIIDLWEKEGLVTVEETDNPLVWMNEIGDVLLYDRPNMSWLPSGTKYNLGLFGNPSPPSDGKSNNWIFWGRQPKILEQYAKNEQMSYSQRPFDSIFVGNTENTIQKQFRNPEQWNNVITKFELTNGHKHKYTQREYLQLLQRSKFGLCLRGFGPKCNREIELLALGVIPLITNDVSLDYYDPLIEGLHYFRVESPDDISKIIEECSEEMWTVMSNACREWYHRNCTTKGSFETTMKIIRRYNQPNIQSVSTMATMESWNDLDILLKSVTLFNPEIPLYIGSDQGTVEKLATSDHKNNLNINIVQCLDEYTGKNREQMEKEGTWLDFMLRKCDAIDVALENHDNTLFLDSDTCLMAPIDCQDFDFTKDIGRSHHDIKKSNEEQFGKYNGGCVFVNHPAFTLWWKLASQDSRFYEQACLEDADDFFSTFGIPTQYNFGWWRLFECPEGQLPDRLEKFTFNNDGTLMYNNKPLRSIHTHFVSNFVHTVNFNNFIMKLLNENKTNAKLTDLKQFIAPRAANNQDSQSTNAIQPEEVGGHSTNSATDDTTSDSTNDKGIHLIFQYCNTNNQERQKEYDFCVLQNLNNPHITALYNMKESKTIVPEFLKNHPKYNEIPLDRWLRYKDAFEYANKNLINKIVGLCNLDIFFDPKSSWDKLQHLIPEHNVTLHLSRFEYDGNNSAKRDPDLMAVFGYANCQDAWLFQSPIFVPMQRCDFEIGRPGCDNAIAERIKSSGYTPWNPSNEYRIFHYDICRGKTGKNYLQKTYEEEHRKNKNVFPEEDGCYLLPDKDFFTSLDTVATTFGLSDLEKYKIICDIVSDKVKINNRPRN